jgi:nitroimidazol reductase NimA-like FMN-containing flavoprotein (pyridoxamine 5'-phosphate oxidase superfamily)
MSDIGHRALTPERCRQLLGQSDVGRVVFTRQALPAIVPVRYHLAADELVLHAVAGAEWPGRVAGTVVAFEVDHFGDPGDQDWSVVVIGRARPVEPPHGGWLVLDLRSALLTGNTEGAEHQITA